jgi:hypothetical protein
MLGMMQRNSVTSGSAQQSSIMGQLPHVGAQSPAFELPLPLQAGEPDSRASRPRPTSGIIRLFSIIELKSSSESVGVQRVAAPRGPWAGGPWIAVVPVPFKITDAGRRAPIDDGRRSRRDSRRGGTR